MVGEFEVVKTSVERYRSKAGQDVRDFRVFLLDRCPVGDGNQQRLGKIAEMSLEQADEDRMRDKLQDARVIVHIGNVREIGGRTVFEGKLDLKESNGTARSK